MTFEQAKSIVDNKGICFYADNDGEEHEVELLSASSDGYAYITDPSGYGDICVGIDELELELPIF